MSVLASTAILGLAWFGTVNAAASLLSWSLSLLVADRVSGDLGRARMLLALRFLPFMTASIVSVALFLPAHVNLEPANPDERFGVLPLMLAAAAALLVGRALYRLCGIILASVRLAASIREHAAPSDPAAGVDLPLLDGIALAGVIRPRVLVGTKARQVLTPAELDVALAHELAHLRARDNLTRALMLCAPDFLSFTCVAGRLERLWEGEAECLADARAAAGDAERGTQLASALLKVARLSSLDRPVWAHEWSTFHKPALLETRVRLLVKGQLHTVPDGRYSATLSAVLAAAVMAAWSTGLPGDLHRLTETIIARVP